MARSRDAGRCPGRGQLALGRSPRSRAQPTMRARLARGGTGDRRLGPAPGGTGLPRRAVRDRLVRRPPAAVSEPRLVASDRVRAGARGLLHLVDLLRGGRHRGHQRPGLPADLPRAGAGLRVLRRELPAPGADRAAPSHHLDRRLRRLALRQEPRPRGADHADRAGRRGAVRGAAVQGRGDERGRAHGHRCGRPRADPGRHRVVRRAAAGAVLDPVRDPRGRRHRAPPRVDAGDRGGIAGQAGRLRGSGNLCVGTSSE